jgi:hypothetical protein
MTAQYLEMEASETPEFFNAGECAVIDRAYSIATRDGPVVQSPSEGLRPGSNAEFSPERNFMALSVV